MSTIFTKYGKVLHNMAMLADMLTAILYDCELSQENVDDARHLQNVFEDNPFVWIDIIAGGYVTDYQSGVNLATEAGIEISIGFLEEHAPHLLKGATL